MNILVTGNAGFIGFHVARRLIERGDTVIGFDVVNDYYDVALKEARLAELEGAAGRNNANYTFVRADLVDFAAVRDVFDAHRIERVIHLAAQAGVRHSIEDPHSYAQSNLVGFTNILEACRHANVAHLTFASTSSVYGANKNLPYSEHQGADHPLQFYAATKRANELMAHSYAHLFRLPVTGLRFFTVYGPWGRPDMALFTFTRKILADEPIDVFNEGAHTRDFTYIDDIVEGIIRASDQPATPNPNWDAQRPDPATSSAPFRLFNIGNSDRVSLSDYIEALEQALGRTARRNLVPLQAGDVPDTWADTTELQRATGYRPATPVREGIQKFVDWYLSYHAGAHR